MTEIHVNHNMAKNRFEVDLDGKLAMLIYSTSGNLMLMLHTEVPPAFEGRGIAGKMARAALEYAMEKNYTVRSYCTFTTTYIERHPEYQPMLG